MTPTPGWMPSISSSTTSSASDTATSTRVESTVEMGSSRRGKNTLPTSAALLTSELLERVAGLREGGPGDHAGQAEQEVRHTVGGRQVGDAAEHEREQPGAEQRHRDHPDYAQRRLPVPQRDVA